MTLVSQLDLEILQFPGFNYWNDTLTLTFQLYLYETNAVLNKHRYTINPLQRNTMFHFVHCWQRVHLVIWNRVQIFDRTRGNSFLYKLDKHHYLPAIWVTLSTENCGMCLKKQNNWDWKCLWGMSTHTSAQMWNERRRHPGAVQLIRSANAATALKTGGHTKWPHCEVVSLWDESQHWRKGP